MKDLLAKINDLELEIEVLKHQNRQILEHAVAEKKTLEKLAQKAALYFNNADLGYVILDKTLQIVDVNDSFMRLCGYDKEEVLFLPIRRFFTTNRQYEKWLNETCLQGEFESVCNLEYRLLKKNGHRFWAELFGRKFIDEGQELTIWSVRDITLRVKSRNTIARLNLKYQKRLRDLSAVLEIIPVPVFIKDRNFRYIGCSRSFCAYFGLKKEDILGKTANDLYPTEIAQRLNIKDKEMYETEFQVYRVTTVSPFSQEEVRLEIQKKRIMREGKFDGFVGVFIDMTEVEKQEHYLQNRINEEVKKNLQIQEIYQEEMIRNAKFSAIGQMAAGITHEINTPLTYIKGNFEILVEDIKAYMMHSPQKIVMLQDTVTIHEGIERIESIIETMREASQKSREQKENVNIYESVVSALILSYNRSKQVVGITINQTPFSLQTPKRTHYWVCHLQKQRIEQVWLIILNNALDELIKIDTFEKRKLNIEIFEENTEVVVRFCDKAGGIDPKILPRIFEPFESTKESSGIGIGLNIAQQIVLQNDGEIRAYNEEDGAVFEVRFALSFKESFRASF
jgi:PAS domain S-box-containing protein